MVKPEISLAQYFEQNNHRLARIEQGILAQKTVFTFKDFCRYTGISESWGYKLTSQRAVPHYSPNGKTLYFEKAQIDKWLLQNPVRTVAQLKNTVVEGANK
jgi:predicted DNA-binding transcriptional regulator AlpA